MSLIGNRQKVLGSYDSNAFCIWIGDNIARIGESKLEFDSARDLSIFIHEYWHYLINLSTIAGYKEFRLWHSLISLFSTTLVNSGNETCNPKYLSTHDNKTLSSLLEILTYIMGDSNLSTFSQVKDIQVISYDIIRKNVWLDGQNAPCNVVKLGIVLDSETVICNTQRDFYLGTLAIDEGLAYEVDQLIAGNDSSYQSPPLPYWIIRRLAEYILGYTPTGFELCGLATLSLLTTNPAEALILCLESYRKLPKSESVNKRLERLWEGGIKREFLQAVDTATMDLEELQEIYKGRGLLQYALEYLSESYVGLWKRRESDPLFELKAFREDECNQALIKELFGMILPCDTVIVRDGDCNNIGKDVLISFGLQDHWKETGFCPTDFLRSLQCQLHFLSSHLYEDGFISSIWASPAKCPFYTVCDSECRMNTPMICRDVPWRTYQRDDNDVCWYGSAVVATLAIVEISKP